MTLDTIKIDPPSGSKAKYSLVALHGWGSNAQDLAALVPSFNLPDWQFILPNAPFPHPAVPDGFAWYSFDSDKYDGLLESKQRLGEFLQSLQKDSEIPLSRTILAGFSQGGAMTLEIGLNLPLAGLCCLSGYLHSLPPVKENFKFPPVLIVHGDRDQIVPVKAAIAAKDKLTSIGVEVEYSQFEMGHEIQPPVIALIEKFIFARSLG